MFRAVVAQLSSPKVLLATGAAAYGLFVYALLPQGIVALNDDFAYLRSVVETLQQGRLWTDDWLEPWAAGLTLLSAVAFKVTGSFHFATYGLLALFAAAAFFLTGRLMLARNFGVGRTLLLTAFGLTFSTLLWKQVQFTGMALYLPCLLGALWAAEERRWGFFLLAWSLALATRQSALLWVVWLVAAVAEHWWRERKMPVRAWLGPVLAGLAGFGLYLALNAGMNKTVAQSAITDRMLESWSIAQARNVLSVGVVALLLAAGWGAGVLWCRGESTGPGRTWPVWGTMTLLAGGALLLAVNVSDHLAFEFDTFNSAWGAACLKLMMVVGAAGLALGRFSFRLLPLAGALAALVALSFRGVVWDYYLVDVCVLGFFAVKPAREPGEARPVIRWAWAGALGVLAVFQLGAALQIKSTLDRTHVLFELGGRSIEEGRIPANQASFLPFGLMAWYYFPLHLQQAGRGGVDPADFGRYLEQDTVLTAWRYSKPLRSLPGHDGGLPEDRSTVILGGKFNYCWLYGVEVLLLPAPAENRRAAKSPFPPGYVVPAFPRDDAGWRALIAGETKLAVP